MTGKNFDVDGMRLELKVKTSEGKTVYTLFDVTDSEYPIEERIFYTEQLDGLYPLYKYKSIIRNSDTKPFGIAKDAEEAVRRLDGEVEKYVEQLRIKPRRWSSSVMYGAAKRRSEELKRNPKQECLD